MASMIRGGGETFDIEISRALNGLNCETTLLTSRPVFGRPHVCLDVKRCVFIRTPNTSCLPRAYIPGGWHIRMMDCRIFEHRAAQWAYGHRSEFDLIQVCEQVYFVAAWNRMETGCPVVMRLTAPDYYDPVNAVTKADAVIASGTTMEKMRAGPRPDCVDIPNAVDPRFFYPRPSEFRRNHGIGSADPLFIYAARMVPFKRHQWLLDVFSGLLPELPAAKLLLVGHGQLEDGLRKYCAQKGLLDSVIFMGQMPYEKMPEIYAAADIKVIASDHRESFCFAALEAMAMGLPLVSTACGMLPSLIGENEGGRIVNIDDALGFQRALLSLTADPAARKRIGARNREYVITHHSWQSSARKLRTLYERLVARGAKSGKREEERRRETAD